MTTGVAAAGPVTMRYTVDAWDPGYGTSFEAEEELRESTARIVAGVEVPDERWRPIPVSAAVTAPAALLFVDGVRRIDARVWIDGGSNGSGDGLASAGIGASYAAGVVCCCGTSAHLLGADIRRGLFTVAPYAADVVTSAGRYQAFRTAASAALPQDVALAAALQGRLRDLELAAAIAARGELTAHGVPAGDDLLVVDGSLHERQHLPRAIGYIKSHRRSYLPPALNSVIRALADRERTPIFLMGTSWDRHAWYLRLPGDPGSPWAGIVRIECGADLPRDEVIRLADLSQAVLCRFASAAYKDPRAPQNLYPIAGLERELRRRLGDTRLLYRALRRAASAGAD